MLLNGQGQDHDSSGLNNYPKKGKAEVCGSKISSNTGVVIHRFYILFIMMFICGASSTSLLHADNDEQRNHLPRMTTQELKLNNNSADHDLDQSSNIHSSSTPVDHGHGKESSYSYLPTYLEQELEESSNIRSSSTTGDHGGWNLHTTSLHHQNKSIDKSSKISLPDLSLNSFLENLDKTFILGHKEKWYQHQLQQSTNTPTSKPSSSKPITRKPTTPSRQHPS